MKKHGNSYSLFLKPEPSIFICMPLQGNTLPANKMKTIFNDRLQSALPTIC